MWQRRTLKHERPVLERLGEWRATYLWCVRLVRLATTTVLRAVVLSSDMIGWLMNLGWTFEFCRWGADARFKYDKYE